MAEKITIESAEPFRVCNSCYKGDRVYNIIIRYASTNSGTQISLCCDCLKKLNNVIGETLWKEDGARIAETHEKREETHACDLISRQAALDALDKRFDSIPMEQTTEILLLRKDLRDLPSAQPERLTDDDFETIRILLNADKEKLCNQRRWKEAEEYQRIIDRFMAFASAQPAEADVQKMQGLEQAEIQKAYELGKLDAMEEMPHWIPCSERMPENNDEVLVTYTVNGKRHRYVETATWYDGDEGYWSSPWDEYRVPGTKTEVIAWMPLPKPYTGEDCEQHG